MDNHFATIRIEKTSDLPAINPRMIDIAVLDMNHRWKNLGHDSLVHAVRETSAYFLPFLTSADLTVRVLSFEVRQALMIPDLSEDRFRLILGTGGPGHLDPLANDGINPWSQGVHEDPAWERPLFDLFDVIAADDRYAMFAVCHTFGILCRWAGFASPIPRTDDRGGKSTGVRNTILTTEALAHPWFGRFASELPDGRHFRVIDSRYFDLVPEPGFEQGPIIPLAFEAKGPDGPATDAVTMVEIARDRGGVMPRILAVNHHPEVFDREHALEVLAEKVARREVSDEWYRERAETLAEQFTGDNENQLRLTSQFTLLLPLQFHLARIIRNRREEMGLRGNFHEDQLVRAYVDSEEEVTV